MAGKIYGMIQALIERRTNGDAKLAPVEKIKLIMKGVDPEIYNPESADDPIIINRLQNIARALKIEL
jgi:hypothetical protein